MKRYTKTSLNLGLCSYLLALLLLTGCSDYQRESTTISGDRVIDIICIDSVEYIIWTTNKKGFLAPHFKPDGTLHTCEQKQVK